MRQPSRGKQVFMETLIGEGVEFVFSSPGTTERPLIEPLYDYSRVSVVVDEAV